MALYPVKTSDTRTTSHSFRQQQGSWRTTMTGSEVVDPEQHSAFTSVSREGRKKNSKGKPPVWLRIIYTLSGQRTGGIRASSLYFGSLHSTLNKQTYWEEYFFLFLRKHLQSWKEIKTVISKMKTKQCRELDDWATGGQSSASCWVPGTGPLGQLRKSTGDSQNGHCLSETHLPKW